MIADNDIDTLNPQQLRQALRAAQAQVAVKSELVARHERTVAFKQTVIDKLTHEMAVLKRLKFAATSERFSPEQKSLLEEAIDEDLEALAREVERLVPDKDNTEKRHLKRQALPAELPRREIRHEPEIMTCGCGCELKRIGQDVAEKLDYTPGTFTVERHVRGKWACTHCRTLVQAPTDRDAIIGFVEACKSACVTHFELLSSVGADAASRSFYRRTCSASRRSGQPAGAAPVGSS